MKIHIDGVNPASTSGPNSFGMRLTRALFESGHTVDFDNGPNCDVSLVFIEPTGVKLARRIIQRLDGIWFKPNEFVNKNIRIKELYDSANSVIWQSEFDRQMTVHHWGNRPGIVIHNGCDIIKDDVPAIVEMQDFRQKYDKLFVCSANWHPQKRLQTNVELFRHIRNNLNVNCALFVLGNNPDYVPQDKLSQHIFYAGSLPHKLCFSVYAHCDLMLHCAWLDHCPNVVVEALACETPVICTSEGGTKEIINGYGEVINDIDSYQFQLVDYDNPPTVDVTQLRKIPCLDKHLVPNVSMSTCVNKYVKLFEEVLSG